MSDDQINPGLHAYAEQVRRTAQLAPAAEIRRRGDRRRRNRAVGASFAVVLIAAVGVGTLLDRRPHRPVIPAGPSPSASVAPSRAAAPPSYQPSSAKRSDVSQLRELGIDLRTGVLIDVADDDGDHWMQAVGDVVDFTGDKKENSTRMSLQPAPVTEENSVLIIPPAQPGMCVTATRQLPLALEPCADGNKSQIWKVSPAGDSGQFELVGRFGSVRVDGRVGLQTIKF